MKNQQKKQHVYTISQLSLGRSCTNVATSQNDVNNDIHRRLAAVLFQS